MKTRTYILVIWFLMPLSLMANLPNVHSFFDTSSISSFSSKELKKSDLSEKELLNLWFNDHTQKPISKQASSKEIPMNFDFFRIVHSVPTASVPLDAYSVMFTSDTYSGSIQFFKTPTGTEVIPEGVYNVAGDYLESSILMGFEFYGIQLGSIINKMEKGKVVEKYMLVSGSLTVVVDDANANHVTINGTVQDSNGNNLQISADHIISDTDGYYNEPDNNVNYDLQMSRVQYENDTLAHSSTIMLLNDSVSVTLTMKRNAHIADENLPIGTFNINGSGDVNSFTKSSGFDVNNNLVPCYVAINNEDGYPLVSGTVTISKKADQSGYNFVVNAQSYKGSTFIFEAENWFVDLPYQLEGVVIHKVLDYDKCVDQRENTDFSSPLDTFSVHFPSTDFYILLKIGVQHSNATELPTGVYTVGLPLANNVIKKSEGAGSNEELYSIVLADLNSKGEPKSAYFITSGTLSKIDDPAHVGEFIYSFKFTTYFGSVFESVFKTYIEPYGIEPLEKANYTEAWTYANFTHTAADASKNEHFDLYTLNLEDQENNKSIILSINGALASPATLAAGTYTIASVMGENTINVGHVSQLDRTKILPSYVTIGEGDAVKTYFLVSGTCEVEYPDANNPYHIVVTLAAISAHGSIFNITVDHVIDPFEGYTYKYEDQTKSAIISNPIKSELSAVENKANTYTLVLSTDTTVYNLELFANESNLASLPAGVYNVNKTKNDFTVLASSGISPLALVSNSYFGGLNERGQLSTVYYIASGTLTITDSNAGQMYNLNFVSHYGSTIKGEISLGTGLESVDILSMNAYVDNGNIIVDTINQQVEVYNTLGQKVAVGEVHDGKAVISGLPTSTFYIVNCGNESVKLYL